MQKLKSWLALLIWRSYKFAKEKRKAGKKRRRKTRNVLHTIIKKECPHTYRLVKFFYILSDVTTQLMNIIKLVDLQRFPQSSPYWFTSKLIYWRTLCRIVGWFWPFCVSRFLYGLHRVNATGLRLHQSTLQFNQWTLDWRWHLPGFPILLIFFPVTLELVLIQYVDDILIHSQSIDRLTALLNYHKSTRSKSIAATAPWPAETRKYCWYCDLFRVRA